ncbi:MAG: pilus assembly protein PilM, partial [Candidatus Eremiobacteraeota bacterium]|nr:pilus assembly protein PilM [Candidatus Eremiobacteraeota bacterium]
MSFLNKFFARGGNRFVGVDFGSHELKAVQYVGTPRGPMLEHVYRVSTPANGIKDGVVSDPQLVGEALRQLFTDGSFTARRTISAVSGPTVVVRQVTMPLMNERELRDSTKYEAERFLPYSVEEAQIDSKILGKT